MDRLVQKLSAQSNVKMYLNEPIEKLEIDSGQFENSVRIKSKTREDTADIVISSVFSKCQFDKDLSAKISDTTFILFFF